MKGVTLNDGHLDLRFTQCSPFNKFVVTSFREIELLRYNVDYKADLENLFKFQFTVFIGPGVISMNGYIITMSGAELVLIPKYMYSVCMQCAIIQIQSGSLPNV